MRIGLNFTPKHDSPEEWAQILAEKGFRAAAFPVDYQAPVHVIDAYVRAAQAYDIKIGEVGVWNSPNDPDIRKAARMREVCLEQFKLAEYVKASCCVNVSGAAGPVWYGCYRENFSEDLYRRNVEFIQELCDQVKPQYTCYTLETMQWMLPDSPEQYLQCIKDVDRAHFAVHMDAINFIKDPHTYTHMEDVLERSFQLLGPYIKCCHLKDCRLMEGTTVVIREVETGQGEFPLASYLKYISELDDDMPVLLEHLDDMKLYEQELAYIRTLKYE